MYWLKLHIADIKREMVGLVLDTITAHNPDEIKFLKKLKSAQPKVDKK